MLAALPADVHLHDACKTFTAVRTGYQVLHFGCGAVAIPGVKPPTWQPVILFSRPRGLVTMVWNGARRFQKFQIVIFFGFLTWVEGCRCPMLRKRL